MLDLRERVDIETGVAGQVADGSDGSLGLRGGGFGGSGAVNHPGEVLVIGAVQHDAKANRGVRLGEVKRGQNGVEIARAIRGGHPAAVWREVASAFRVLYDNFHALLSARFGRSKSPRDAMAG